MQGLAVNNVLPTHFSFINHTPTHTHTYTYIYIYIYI